MSSAAPNHFVTIRLSALGDLVLTTGVLEYWHKTRGWTFTVITRAGLAPVLQNLPAVTETLTVRDDQLDLPNWLRFIWSLRKTHGHFPLIDLHGSLRTRIMRILWPDRTAAYPKHSLTRRIFLKTRMELFGARLRRTTVPQRYAMAMEQTPPPRESLIPHIRLSHQEIRTAGALLPVNAPASPVIALHPYSTHPAKEWQRENWLQLTTLLDRQGLPWIVVGRDEFPLAPGSDRDLTNTTPLRETAALLSLCSCLVTGDSGPMHMATAVGTPVVALFGPTSREWGFYPCGPRDIILQETLSCAPCSLHGKKGCPDNYACMRAITPDRVVEALLAHIS